MALRHLMLRGLRGGGGVLSRGLPSSSSGSSSIMENRRRQASSTPVTLIQGDGVYPEILDSVQAVLSTMGAPVQFESFFLSDIHEASSAKLDDVVREHEHEHFGVGVSLSRFFVFIKEIALSPRVTYRTGLFFCFTRASLGTIFVVEMTNSVSL